jgi:hypothetical protein
MTLILSLIPELELHLVEEAKQQGLTVDNFAVQILAEYILLKRKLSERDNLLQSQIEIKDTHKQLETDKKSIHTLDDERFPERKLFPLLVQLSAAVRSL